MPPTRAVYSVIQYVPDPGRAEGANAGVVLYVPSAEWIRVKPSPTLERVRKFFAPPPDDLKRIQSAVKGLCHRLEAAERFAGEQDLARFASSRADAVRITAPRLVMVTDPAADLDALYADLVGDREAVARAGRAVRALPPRLAEVFGRLIGEGKAWEPGPITVPTIRRRFVVTAAFQNGVTNYVRSESLARGKWQDKVEKLGFNGRLIARHPVDGRPAQLVVVSSDPAAGAKVEDRSRETLKEFGVQFVPYSGASEYAAKVEETAHR